MVRSATADREHPSILFPTGYTRGYSKLDPPQRINPALKSYSKIRLATYIIFLAQRSRNQSIS
ncbi:MAG: hypothetical protein NWS12_10060, partial [Algoriphagus sp.]|nr:hypothetical protein [Algoriphagus sp.]